MAKLKFVGGTVNRVSVVDGRRVVEEVEPQELTQLFEDTEYHWPQVGAVLQVDDNVGSWLKGKLKELVVFVPEEEREKPKGAARRVTAQMPREKKDEKPQQPPK